MRKVRWRRDRLPTPVFLGFPCGSAGKESACNVGDLGSIPGLGRSPGEGKGYPLQYFGLENTNIYTVHGVAKRYSNMVYVGDVGAKESTCQCRRHKEGKRYRFSPWRGKIPWRRKWYLTLVFLPGESHRQKSLVDYNPGGHRVRHN